MRETVVMTFKTSLDKQHNVRFNQPRANVTMATLNNPIQLLTNGTQYFDDKIGLLTNFIQAKRVTVATETIL